MRWYLFFEGQEQPHKVAKGHISSAWSEWIMGMGELIGALKGRLPRRVIIVRFI